MTKYVYPAIFSPEENGKYSVSFPDLSGTNTCGNNLEDAIFMAEDCLAFSIYCKLKRGEILPAPSAISDIHPSDGDFASLIRCDILEYQKRNNTKAVKKTLSIPEWLNEAAVEANLNFSQILQEGLKAKLSL